MAKEISELTFKDDVKYAKDHEWVKKEGTQFRIGISDYAQDQLGDIVFVELPAIGDEYEIGHEFGSVESTKAVSELFMPVSGKVVSVNTDLADSPELVNSDPFGKGWMIMVAPSNPTELDQLMDQSTYIQMLKGLKK